MISALLAAAAVAASQAQAPHAVVDWSRSGAGAGRWRTLTLVAALRLGVSGQTQIDCLVAVDGKTYDCKTYWDGSSGGVRVR